MAKVCSDEYKYMLEHKYGYEHRCGYDHNGSEIDNNKFTCFNRTQLSNPLNPLNKCLLVSSRKSYYYIYNYKPSIIINRIKYNNQNNTFLQSYMVNLSTIFDLQDDTHTKRCNCIAITLYWTDKLDLMPLLSYLTSIWQSVKNVNDALVDWIVRVYLDESVHQALINKYNDNDNDLTTYLGRDRHRVWEDCMDTYNNIINADNTEIYTYLCEDDDYTTERKRLLRFLPFIDPQVNMVIVRDTYGEKCRWYRFI